MKFGKTYAALIYDPSFPPEWRDKAINYRQLKKLINQVAIELEALGLNPAILRTLLAENLAISRLHNTELSPEHPVLSPMESGLGNESSEEPNHASAVYEVTDEGAEVKAISPRIRLRVPSHLSDQRTDGDITVAALLEKTRHPDERPLSPSSRHTGAHNALEDGISILGESTDSEVSLTPPTDEVPLPPRDHTTIKDIVLLSTTDALCSQGPAEEGDPDPTSHTGAVLSSSPNEVVIPLSSDLAFFHLLTGTLNTLAELHQSILDHSNEEIMALDGMIARCAHPRSSGVKSDLDAWREIFRLYVEIEIFESESERHRGERSWQEVEVRLKKFGEQIANLGKGHTRAIKLKESKDALARFYALNALMLDLKKFQFANAEATRKILKKHEKRTALPSAVANSIPALSLQLRGSSISLPHILLVKITETLLPIIPVIEDYACLICTSIAYLPIRLACGHLFCVRCLSKMQKRRQPEHERCALCRAPTVFTADASNLDLALKRFMKDWFPTEVKIKKNENAKEVASEMVQEFGMAVPPESNGMQ